MLPHNLKRVVAGFFVVGALGAGAFPEFLGAQDKQGTTVPVVEAREIVKTFETNAATADVRYMDKRVAVRGKLLEIRGTHVLPNKEHIKVLYSLDMAFEDGVTSPYVTFSFTDQEQQQLAQLKQGQEVTIEGTCNGWSPGEPVGGKYISFSNNKVIHVGK